MSVRNIKTFLLCIISIPILSNSVLLQESQNQNVLSFSINYDKIHTIEKHGKLEIYEENVAIYFLSAQPGDSIEIYLYKDTNINGVFDISDSLTEKAIVIDDCENDEYSVLPRIIKYHVNYLMQKSANIGHYFLTINNGYKAKELEILPQPETIIFSRSEQGDEWRIQENNDNWMFKQPNFKIFEQLHFIDKEESSRIEKARDLSKSDRKNDIKSLFRMLDDESFFVRSEVFEIISRLKNKTVFNLLSKNLKSKNHRKKIMAIDILDEINEPITIDLLSYALHDENIEIQEAAIEALINKLSNDTLYMKICAQRPFQKDKRKAVTQLINLSKNENVEFPKEVIILRGFLGDKGAVESLMPLLNDPSTDIQISVIRTLGYLGDPRPIESLINLMENSEQPIKFEIANALDNIVSNIKLNN